MNLKVRLWILSLALAGAFALSACGNTGGGANTGGGGATTNLDLTTPGETLAFQPAALTAKTGTAVKVTFKNGSTAQQHNFVLVKGGDDVAKTVDDAGATAGADKGYIPTDPNIIAHSNLTAAGGTGTADFTAPAPGTYTFLCTFPGHFVAGMKGTLTVTQ